jgi:uncharacterized membrane protein
MSAVMLASYVGNLFAILLVLFVPGYVLVAALFPQNTEIDWIERIALSFGLSIAIVPLLGLLLNFTPWGIRFAPIVVTTLVFTVGVGSAAYWRRMRMPPSTRLAASVVLTLPAWREYSVLDQGLAVILAASIFIGGGTLAYFVLTPRPGETFTEFYILGPDGKPSGYPRYLNASQPGTVILGIANHESTSVNYSIRIDLVGVRIVYNATSKSNETFEVNRTTWPMLDVALANGGNWTRAYMFRIDFAGLWKIQFFLFNNGDFSSPYRKLHIFVTVR